MNTCSLLFSSEDFIRRKTFSNGLSVCWTTTPSPPPTNETQRNERKNLLQYSMEQHLSFMTMHIFLGGVDFFEAWFYAMIQISHLNVMLKYIRLLLTDCTRFQSLFVRLYQMIRVWVSLFACCVGVCITKCGFRQFSTRHSLTDVLLKRVSNWNGINS